MNIKGLDYNTQREKLVMPEYGREIEKMVEDYRRTLYAQAYEEWLVERRMPKGVPDSTIAQVYAQMPDRFRLDESIVKYYHEKNS